MRRVQEILSAISVTNSEICRSFHRLILSARARERDRLQNFDSNERVGLFLTPDNIKTNLSDLIYSALNRKDSHPPTRPFQVRVNRDDSCRRPYITQHNVRRN